MSDTVFILGAGFSHDAEVPLLRDFVETMELIAARKAVGKVPIDPQDSTLLERALDIRAGLDSFHGRASFDDRNIEDIMSILSFDILAGVSSARDRLNVMRRAIARTIELCCTVTFPDHLVTSRLRLTEPNTVYQDFWHALLRCYLVDREIPTIITLNYDLVLERSLFQTLNSAKFLSTFEESPWRRIAVHYAHQLLPSFEYDLRLDSTEPRSINGEVPSRRVSMMLADPDREMKTAHIEILKLHGSLNFPHRKRESLDLFSHLVNSIDNPDIVPPITDKSGMTRTSTIWSRALLRLRHARNIVIVGYSLPLTDIYMQYFLKAAVGPNAKLSRIHVFDPVLMKDGIANDQMRYRFEQCFSPQMKSRISFGARTVQHTEPGTTEQFVWELSTRPGRLLY